MWRNYYNGYGGYYIGGHNGSNCNCYSSSSGAYCHCVGSGEYDGWGHPWQGYGDWGHPGWGGGYGSWGSPSWQGYGGWGHPWQGWGRRYSG